MICIVASPSCDSKQISFLAINMPHLLRFAQTGINQHDASQQSPLMLHSTPIGTIHIKMTRMKAAPFLKTPKTMRKTCQSNLSPVSNPLHSWANVTYFKMDPYLHHPYDLHHLLVITTHTIPVTHIRRLSNRMVRLPIQFGHPDLQYSHVPMVNQINHDRMHHRSLKAPLSQHLRTSLPPLLSNLI